ncbi:MAG: Coenzyme F420 hydrogenase/dehydrogenase, beta subunit C-terminal domain, partial [Candidatus Hermodarchaeota archaeon]
PLNNGNRSKYAYANKIYNFNSISMKKLLYATYRASFSYHYRSIYKAKDKILNSKRYNQEQLDYLLYSIFEAETARKYILEELIKYNPLTIDEIKKIFDFSEETLLRDIFCLKEQGYLEECIKKISEKATTNQVNLLKPKETLYTYKVKQILESNEGNYFKSVYDIPENNLCCHCGLCTAICPVKCNEIIQNDLYINETECINCGLCYNVCPQTFSIDNLKKIIRKSDSSLKYSSFLGYYKNIYSAKSLKYTIKKIGQDGGVVTSLLYYLFSSNLIDAAVTIKHHKKNWKPEVSIIESTEDLYETAGSTYVHAPILSVLDKLNKYKKVAIVALPCKIKALFKGELFPAKLPFLLNIKYKIGLFCKESFPYEKIIKLLRDKFGANINEITKMNISSGKFIITLESGEIFSYPLEECNLYCSDFCNYCDDFTAELADISVGAIGSRIGWSSVILRTKKGENVFNGAVRNNLIEVEKLKDKKHIQKKIERLAEIKRNNSMQFEFNAIEI